MGGHIDIPQKHNVNLVVVVPVYNEEKTVKDLLSSLNCQTYKDFELILVDNCSTDDTVSVVETAKAKLFYNIFVLGERKPGPGNARKRGMDEAIYRFYTKPNFSDSLNYIIVTTDADAKPPKGWLKSIYEEFRLHNPGGLAGTHIADEKINKKIYLKLNLLDYFNAASKFITYCAKNNIGKLKMSGPNSSFSIEAYCTAGGAEQPYIGSKVGVREIKLLQDKILKAGYKILPLYEPVVVSQRRHLFEILNGGIHGCYISQDSQERFLAIREPEEALLEKALKIVPKETWINYQSEIMKAVVKNIIFEPLVKKEIQLESISGVLDGKTLNQVRNDLVGSPDPDFLTEKYFKPVIAGVGLEIEQTRR